jgi:hypothetical protein
MRKDWVVTPRVDTKLASVNGWTLEGIGPYDGGAKVDNDYRYVSLIKHECYPEGQAYTYSRSKMLGPVVHQVVCYPEDTDRCWRCEEIIPDMMVVLWNFQNWDKIQRRRGT